MWNVDIEMYMYHTLGSSLVCARIIAETTVQMLKTVSRIMHQTRKEQSAILKIGNRTAKRNLCGGAVLNCHNAVQCDKCETRVHTDCSNIS